MPTVGLSAAVMDHLEPGRDILDYLSDSSGIVGALLAGGAFIYAAVQGSRAKKALLHERRADFELGLLAEMRRQMSVTQFSHLSGYVGALVRDETEESELAVLRAAVGTKSGPVGREQLSRLSRTEQLSVAEAEIDAAIERRLVE